MDRLQSSSTLLAIGNTALVECQDFVIVSLACPQRKEAPLKQRLEKTFAVDWPSTGEQRLSRDKHWRLFGLQPEQRWLLGTAWHACAPRQIIERLGDTARCTDQSDGWVVLRLSGALSGAVLERSCSLDLASDRFPPQGVARTVMDHLPAIVARDGINAFLLFSPRSSAQSFRQMLETSMVYLAPTGV